MEILVETIAAIATPPGDGAIGIVRFSGPQALSIAERIFVPTTSRKGRGIAGKPRTAILGSIREPETSFAIDQVLLTYFARPNSYTGEDLIEISGHGGIYVLHEILDLILKQGARLAKPG